MHGSVEAASGCTILGLRYRTVSLDLPDHFGPRGSVGATKPDFANTFILVASNVSLPHVEVNQAFITIRISRNLIAIWHQVVRLSLIGDGMAHLRIREPGEVNLV